MHLTVYHGTDLSAANKIINDKFKCRSNPEHWLGNGIYFYQDKALAEWWTSHPSSKFGCKVKEPALLICEIEIEDDRILNLCCLDGYKEYWRLFDDYFRNLYSRIVPNNELTFSFMRTLFFDSIFQDDQYDIIMAPFFVPEQPYFPKIHYKWYDKMHILYNETQICLNKKKQEYIIKKECEVVKK